MRHVRHLLQQASRGSASRLVASFFWVPRAIRTIFPRRFYQVRFSVVHLIHNLVARRVPIHANVGGYLVTIILFLPSKGHRHAVKVLYLSLPCRNASFVIHGVQVFPTLRRGNPGSRFVPVYAAKGGFFLHRTVTFYLTVTLSGTAMGAIVLAMVNGFGRSASGRLLSMGNVYYLAYPLIGGYGIPNVHYLRRRDRLVANCVLSIFGFHCSLLWRLRAPF